MNSLDIIIGTIILLIGLSYWTVSVVQYNNNYIEMVKSDYILSKGINTLEKLCEDGTLEKAILLYYFGKVNESKRLLESNIPLSHYLLYIDDNLIINKSGNFNNSYYVLAILAINRSEGWYVIYGNSTNIEISDDRFLSYNEAYREYLNYPIDMPVYLSRSIGTVKVKLVVGS
ncbi:hypothetical protein [Methanocaldococcus infernus]